MANLTLKVNGRTHTVDVESSTPLLYIRDGENMVVIASSGGGPRHPAWWFNLRSRPQARIQIGSEKIDVCWRQAEPGERERLWDKLEESYRFYPEYRKHAQREIPLVILEREKCTLRPALGNE